MHAQKVLRTLGMEECSAVCTPGIDEKADDDEKRRQGRPGGEEKRSEEHQRKKGGGRRYEEDKARERGQRRRKVKEEDPGTGKLEGPLSPEEATRYRAVAARLNYLAQDRADIRVATMRLCARMAAPVAKDMAGLKRVARYLRGVPRVPVLFVWQQEPKKIETYTDSDWAGCKATRRSVSGGAILHGRHLMLRAEVDRKASG